MRHVSLRPPALPLRPESMKLVAGLLLFACYGEREATNQACSVRPGILDKIAIAEGWGTPSSLVRRLHNPGALVYVGQPDARRHSSGYAEFNSEVSGWNALERDLEVKRKRHGSPGLAWPYLRETRFRAAGFLSAARSTRAVEPVAEPMEE